MNFSLFFCYVFIIIAGKLQSLRIKIYPSSGYNDAVGILNLVKGLFTC